MFLGGSFGKNTQAIVFLGGSFGVGWLAIARNYQPKNLLRADYQYFIEFLVFGRGVLEVYKVLIVWGL